MSMKKAILEIEKGINWMYFLENEIEDIFRIINLVQDTPDFFNARLGQSTLKAAADYLEKVVEKERNNDNG